MKTKPYFLRKIKVKKINCRLLQFLFGALKGLNYVTVAFRHSLEPIKEIDYTNLPPCI